MGTFVVEEEDVLRLILGFLHARGHFKAYCALETETQACAEILSPELLFLRRMIHAGKWEETISYLEPLQTQTEAYDAIEFAVRKQQYLEMLNSKKATQQLENAVAKLRSIEPLCSQEEFNSLCFCLTLPRIQDNPDFVQWSKHSGRVQCFDAIREELLDMYPSNTLSGILPTSGLLEVLRQALSYQERVAAAFGKVEETGVYYPHLHDHGWLVLPSMDDALPALESKDSVHLVSFNAEQSSSRRQAASQSQVASTPHQAARSPMRRAPEQPSHRSQSTRPDNRQQHRDAQISERQVPSAQLSPVRRSNEQLSDAWDDRSYGQHAGREPITDTRPNVHSRARAIDAHVEPAPISRVPRYAPKSDVDTVHRYVSRSDVDHTQLPPSRAVADDKPWNRPMQQQPSSPVGHKHEFRPGSAATVGTESLHPSRAVKIAPPSRPVPKREPASKVHRSAVRTELVLQAAPVPIELYSETNPFRTVSFFPGASTSPFFALGTNAGSLNLFRLNRHDGDADDNDDEGFARLTASVTARYNKIHGGSVYTCSWHSTERVLVTGSNDKTVCLVDTTRGDAEPLVLKSHNGTIRVVRFARDGDLNKFVSGGAGDCVIRIWDAQQAQTVGELVGSKSPIHAVAWCGRDLLLSGSEEGGLALWDVRDQRPVWSVNTHARKGIYSIGWDDHASNRAVTGHADGLCLAWDLRQRAILAEKQLHTADCRSIDFFSNLTDNQLSPSERRMVALTASFDGTISASQVVNNNFQVQSTMVGHEDKVLCAELHRASGLVISCGADGKALAWRLYV